MVKAKTLLLKTVKLLDNCAGLGTKTLASGTNEFTQKLDWFWSTKSAMHQVSCAVRASTISSGESRKLRAALPVLEEALDEIVRNNQREVTE